MEILEKTAGDRTALSSRPMITRARHRNALEICAENLARSVTAQELELQAEDLRQATRSLGEITGVVGVEDVLDIIFRDFCIGK